jgi:hypothetical protein
MVQVLDLEPSAMEQIFTLSAAMAGLKTLAQYTTYSCALAGHGSGLYEYCLSFQCF